MNTKLTVGVLLVTVCAGWLFVFGPLGGSGESSALVDERQGEQVAPESPSVELPSIESQDGPLQAAPQAERQALKEGQANDPLRANPSKAQASLLIRTELEDGTPLPNQPITIDPPGAGMRAHRSMQMTSSDAGVALVRALSPGLTRISSSNGASSKVNVLPGQQTEVTLTFKKMIAVQGRVVDAGGNPVAGAGIYLASYRHTWDATILLTHSDGDGRFDLGHVKNGLSIGASTAGYAPSPLVDLDTQDREVTPVEITLVLAPGGGSLTGTVTNQGGAPVSGALVAVGLAPRGYSEREDGSLVDKWSLRSTQSDDAGTFTLEGLPAGVQPFYVSAAGYLPFESSVEVVTGSMASQHAVLEAGMSVRGKVTDQDGNPIEDAVVLRMEEPFVDKFPGQGPTKRGKPFHRPMARSDANGDYLLSDIPAGEANLYASKGTSFWGDDDFKGEAQGSLTGNAGEVLVWNATLELGYRIRGRVQFADGSPMGDVFVLAFPESGKNLSNLADGQGRFSIAGLSNQAYRVNVQIHDMPQGAAQVEVLDIWPSEAEVLITATFNKDEEEKATVRVRIEDPAKRITAGGHSVQFADSKGFGKAKEKDGVFSATLKAGRYQAWLLTGGGVGACSPWFDLAPGEDLDLGVLRTEAPGSLKVVVKRPEGMGSSDIRVFARPDYIYNGERTLSLGQTSCELEDLLPRTLPLRVSGDGISFYYGEVTIESGKTTTVRVTPALAKKAQITFAGSPPNGFGVLDCVIRDAKGDVYFQRPFSEEWNVRLPHKFDLNLPVGTFTVEASTTSGLEGQGIIRVQSLKGNENATVQLK